MPPALGGFIHQVHAVVVQLDLCQVLVLQGWHETRDDVSHVHWLEHQLVQLILTKAQAVDRYH